MKGIISVAQICGECAGKIIYISVSCRDDPRQVPTKGSPGHLNPKGRPLIDLQRRLAELSRVIGK